MNSAFSGCQALASITIGSGLSEGVVFSDCPNLAEILVSEDNPYFSDQDGVLYSKNLDTLVCFPQARGGEFVIPDSVTAIGDFAFEGSALSNIFIPDSVTTLGWNPFTYCSNLTSLIIPDSVTSYEEYFYGFYAFNFNSCSRLISLKLPASVTDIYYRLFVGCNSLTRVYFMGEPPEVEWYWGELPFDDKPDELVIYYVAGTPGWETTFCERPTAPFTPWGRFGSFDVDPCTYADTGSCLGMLEVSLDPWTWCETTACWFNIPEETASEGYGWIYAPEPENLQIVPIDGADIGYSYALEKWLYLTESGWVYML